MRAGAATGTRDTGKMHQRDSVAGGVDLEHGAQISVAATIRRAVKTAVGGRAQSTAWRVPLRSSTTVEVRGLQQRRERARRRHLEHGTLVRRTAVLRVAVKIAVQPLSHATFRKSAFGRAAGAGEVNEHGQHTIRS